MKAMSVALNRTTLLRFALWGTIALWIAVMAIEARPLHLAPHWRQAETQSIALNFLTEPNLLFPRINWGGDGPGYVESEFQIYAGLVAVLMGVMGKSENAGQYLSLLAMACSAVVLCRAVQRHYGRVAGLLAALALLSSRNAILLGSAVMPDALCTLFYVLSMERFLCFIEEGGSVTLFLSAACLSLAGLIKPIALGGGIAQVALVLATRRELLKSRQLWLAWGAVVLIVAAFLAHAVRLHERYGNTFGVISGGDSKFPDMAHLRRPHWLSQAFRLTLDFGLGYLGLFAGAVLVLRRQVAWRDIAFALGGGAAVLVSLRYSSDRWLGAHYHVFLAVAGAWLVGALVYQLHRLPKPGYRMLASSSIGLASSILFVSNLHLHRQDLAYAEQEPVIPLGLALKACASPGDLVVVQSAESSYDAEWKRADNYQDPRVFYVSNTRGWVLPVNLDSSERLASAASRGARFYATAIEPPSVIGKWLLVHAEVVWERGSSRIWRLKATKVSTRPSQDRISREL